MKLRVCKQNEILLIYFENLCERRQISEICMGVIHLVSTQEVPEKLTFLPCDTHIYMCVSGGKDSSFFGKFCIRSK